MNETYFEALARCENGEIDTCFTGEKKKVFLIGDSIRQGYAPFVRECLAGKYDVVFPDENCRNTQYVITSLRTWANMFENKDDVVAVTFNCGHWDIAHFNGDEKSLTAPQEYAGNIRRIARQLKAFFPCAKIMFVTTSPMAPGNKSYHFNPRTNEEIKAYNALALSVCQEEGIPTKDLYAFMEHWGAECYQDYAHPTSACSRILGEEVASAILDMLSI